MIELIGFCLIMIAVMAIAWLMAETTMVAISKVPELMDERKSQKIIRNQELSTIELLAELIICKSREKEKLIWDKLKEKPVTEEDIVTIIAFISSEKIRRMLWVALNKSPSLNPTRDQLKRAKMFI